MGTQVDARRRFAPPAEPGPEPELDPATEPLEREMMETLLLGCPGSDMGLPAYAEELRERVWKETSSVHSLRENRFCPIVCTLAGEGISRSGSTGESIESIEGTPEFRGDSMFVQDESECMDADSRLISMVDMDGRRGISGSGEVAMVAKGRLSVEGREEELGGGVMCVDGRNASLTGEDTT